MNITYFNIGKEAAVKLAESDWWKNTTPENITKFQIMVNETCLPFGVFLSSIAQHIGYSEISVIALAMFRDEYAERIFDDNVNNIPKTLEEVIHFLPENVRQILRINNYSI